MAKRSVESEVKLEAGAGFVTPDLGGLGGGVVAVSLPEQRLTATYVDTPDLRLMRSGVTLRHRHEVAPGQPLVSEWTLKLPLPGDGPMLVRRELRWPGPVEDLPAEAGALVRAWQRSTPLDVVARLVTIRQRTALRAPDGEVLAEMDDDVVSVMDGPRLTARFREIELEVTGRDAPGLVKEVVGRLERAGARRGDDRPKVVRALGAPASAPPDVAAVALGRQATVAEVVRAALADGYLRIVRHHAGVHLDEDIEDVHQARVATRRLRSDLRFLRHSMDREWVRATREELGWLAASLGAVRDADVLAERLRDHGASLPDDDSPAVAELLAILAAERAAALRKLVEAVDSPRYVALLDRLAAAVADPPMASPATPDPTAASEVAGMPEPAAPESAGVLPPADDLDLSAESPPLEEVPAPGDVRARSMLAPAVARPMRHLKAAVDALDKRPSDDQLHQVRIAAKRLRYACETAAPVSGKDAWALGRAAADLQTVLGDFHDTVVAAAWLRRVGAHATPPVALAAGQLIAREHADGQALRSSWGRAWKRLSKKKLVAWLHR
ncbi:CYTH and CHAD domain-containing protein [Acidiferrimicrobium sp. IK]|uniref:CYTH and CHAD domain-containing protein n=1 Tax=Acidiferrimicrobium sp. IK TaxID=2871700 RepID=UPI0021CB322A|nr:CYTH and CHAD domain-containing protein [Acidiferrimicrobium sp. IK]MCU4183985.1 CYTH and CHAD domain-containing protein [Acidiferrimicrobium sp. IK]